MGAMENDPLATYLEALARDDCYCVDRVLKTAPHETTEVVFFAGANDAKLGPFVRKRLSGEVPIGGAYQLLWEAQRAGRRFRYLPRIYDVHERDGGMVVVMEYVAGRTLREEVYECDASVALAARLFPALCDGVIELHEGLGAPVIHRDLKPSNIVVSDEGLTIIDFGIARTFREGAATDTAHFGTRSYAPPEQFGYGQTDERSDVYALGMILYYLVTERDPSPQVAVSGFSGPEVPPALRAVLRRACAFDPAARFRTVRDLKDAFMAVVERSASSISLQGSSAAACKSDTGAMAGEVAPSAVTGPAPSRVVLADNGSVAVVSGASAGTATPTGRVASPVRRAFATVRPSEIVGLIWDGFLGLMWVLLLCVSLTLPFSSDNGYPSWPLWLRVLGYIGFGVPFFTGCLLAMGDGRVFRRAFPHVPFLGGLRQRIGGVVLVVIGVVAVLMAVAVAQGLGLPTVSVRS